MDVYKKKYTVGNTTIIKYKNDKMVFKKTVVDENNATNLRYFNKYIIENYNKCKKPTAKKTKKKHKQFRFYYELKRCVK